MNQINQHLKPEVIELELKIAVEKSIKNTINEAKNFFKNESEIHGYLRCQLEQHFKNNELLNDKTDLIIRECNTKLLYHTDNGIYNGMPYNSYKHHELKKADFKPQSGKFDFAIWNPNKENFYEKGRNEIKKALIGIEVKRQREKVNKKPADNNDFTIELIKDFKKLTDAENEVKYKYSIIIIYYPNVFTLDVERDFGKNLGDINVAYCVVDKKTKKIAQQVYFPNNW